MADLAEIGVFGGSGFYSLLEDVREAKIDTPYGPPSDAFFLATVAGRKVAFLPRHGRSHSIPPHKVNYRANVWAMRSLGVKAVISPCAAGSLQLHVEPGHFVVSDQFVDRTNGRADTFFDGPIVSHVSSAEIYDPVLRRIALEVIREHGITVHDGGTVVVIQGPRFSTKAESKWFSDAGWEVINMTQYPEAYLCRELGMAVVNIALITDYDAGVLEGTHAVTAHDVLAVFEQNAGADPQGGAGHDRAIPGGPGRAGRPRCPRAHARRRPRGGSRGHPACSRRACSGRLPMTPRPASLQPPSRPRDGAADRFAADAAFAREIAERAGRILLERYERVGQIDYKSARDVVTEVDHLSEALIIGAIRDASRATGSWPRSRASTRGPTSTRGSTRRSSASLAHGRTWIIDPLDGTMNYANGLPHFCVSVGLVVDGRPAAGAVHDPMRPETFWATADGPAMLDDAVIHASVRTAWTTT